MGWLVLSAVGFLSGVCASLGIGGGFVLLLYLTAAAALPQREAQLVNLVFFLPIAALSLVFHVKNKLVEFKSALPAAAGGLLGVGLGVWLAGSLPNEWLGKLFAGFIFAVGWRELFSRPRPRPLPPKESQAKRRPPV